MAEVSPMRGRRVKKARCQVEGHGSCEVTQFASPYDRRGEERLFRSDVDAELVDITDEVDPYFAEHWWPWVEEKHTLGYHEAYMWQSGEYDEIAECLRWGLPLDEAG
jgi:hypothetical protein